ncbi:TNT domain-containing protein [Mycobacterium palustre]|uniref:TNT domain-containing protein n=1 Tax=Mycobacterium palustre TaxID=153971 RepID=UPI001FE6626C|nr:TNT domain-containing protein [Mycobacterium palustre]
MRAAAAAWSAAGTRFAVAEILGTGGPMGAVRAQQIPEGALIDRAFTDAFGSTTRLVQQCQTIADQLNSYAAKVDKVHAAILDLLARICDPLTGIKEVWEFLTDDDEDEIKRIADDIRTVVDNFGSEVAALRAEIAATLAEAISIATDMARYVGREWDQFLHATDVGRVVNQVGQYAKGAWSEGGGMVKGLWDISSFRLLFDPIGYGKEVTDQVEGALPLVGLGGEGAPGFGQSWKELGKSVTHWDEWGQNPAEAAGRSVVDLATLPLPGGPLSKLGGKFRALADALRAMRDKPPEIPELPPVEPPKGPPVEPVPSGPKPPEPRGPAPAPPAKPAPGPANGPLPHSPTESKPPVVGKPPTGELPKPAAVPPGAGGKPPVPAPVEQAPLTHSKPLEPVHVSASPVGSPAEAFSGAASAERPAAVAPAAAAAHVPASSAGGLSAEAPSSFGGPPHGSEPAHPPESHPPHGGSPHPPGDSGTPHQPGDGDRSPGSHQPHASAPSDDRPDEPPIEVPAPSDLKPWHQAQLVLAESPDQLVNDLIEHGCPRELAESAMRSPYEGMSAQEILNRFWDPAKGTWKWPEANGFADGKWQTARSIPKEAWLDRIGEVSDARGDFMGALGDSYPDRGLAPGSSGDYNRFRGTGKELPDGWEVRYGKVAGAFGQPGGGTQWVVVDEEGETVLISFLIDNGYLDWG